MSSIPRRKRRRHPETCYTQFADIATFPRKRNKSRLVRAVPLVSSGSTLSLRCRAMLLFLKASSCRERPLWRSVNQVSTTITFLTERDGARSLQEMSDPTVAAK
jgi:hypothetical protein